METKDKKGISMMVVLVIIGIASFLIILFLIFRFDLGSLTNQEICRNSVILKGQSPLPSGSLDCKTNYLCISGGEDCEEISASEKIEVEERNEVMKALADEMASCWYMFGEGKVDYADEGAFEKVACSVCTIVDFDSSLQEKQPISYQEFYDYLRNTNKTKSQTHLQYLYSTDDLNDFGEGFNPENYLSNQINFNKEYFVLTGMTEQGILTPRWKFWNTKFTPQPVVILEKTPENYNAVGCDEFLTKA